MEVPDIHQWFLIQHYVHILQACTYTAIRCAGTHVCMTTKLMYRIAQKFGSINVWRILRRIVLAVESLANANLRLIINTFSGEVWRIKFGEVTCVRQIHQT